jgi:hypothetical protein
LQFQKTNEAFTSQFRTERKENKFNPIKIQKIKNQSNFKSRNHNEVKPFDTHQLQTLDYNRKVSVTKPKLSIPQVKENNFSYVKLNDLIDKLGIDIDVMSTLLVDYSKNTNLIKKEFLEFAANK